MQDEIEAALGWFNYFKATSPSGLNGAMIKAAGNSGISILTTVANELLASGALPSDFKCSGLVPLYKDKGDPLLLNSYPGIKLLEYPFKIIEKVLEFGLRELMDINDTQLGFMPGRGKTDAVFVVRQLREKYIAKKKRLSCIFVDLEEAFGRVPRKVIVEALRFYGVPEPLVRITFATYEG